MLKKTKTEKVFDSKYVNVNKNTVLSSDGKEYEYFTTSTSNGVLVIPIRIKDGKVNFLLTRQYRVAMDTYSVEFPKGALEYGEEPVVAAQRELLEETGYTPTWIKFFYSMHSSPQSTSKMLIYLAMLPTTEPVATSLDYFEEMAELSTMEVTADELLKMIKANEIIDGQSLAAITTVMLQTGAAAQYLETLGG